ncbi:hypothetical protein ACHAW6_001252 [Cyclotella cf. meneghiniana]
MGFPVLHCIKKDGCICWISDVCQLNKAIRCKQYLLPIITDICMQYYTFKLDEHSPDLCTMITPFGKYKP